MASRYTLNVSLVLSFLLVASLAGVWAQGNGLGAAKKARSELVVVDLSELAAANEKAAKAVDLDKGGVQAPLNQEMAFNIAKYEDGNVTCYILSGAADLRAPYGLSCLK